MTHDAAQGVYRSEDGRTFRCIRNGRGRITGYVEVFHSRAAGWVTVPGASGFVAP